MVARALTLIVLIAAIAVGAVVIGPLLFGGAPPAPTPAPSPAATSPRPTATPTPAARPAPTAAATATPTRTPTTTCPPVPPGGREGGFHSLRDVRVAHQAGDAGGFDRVVFDFAQETGASDELPAFRVERGTSFTAISGQRVPVEGAAFWSVRSDGASIADQRGQLVYTGSRDLDPTTTLVRDVKLVEDFEAVMVWAVGLARLECPRVTTLRSPLRLVLDFPTAP